MNIRNRVTSIKRVRAGDLRPNPKNWRTHPKAQRDAMQAVLAEIGMAGMPIVRQLEDGSLMILDGHMRAELMPDEQIDVQVTDFTAEEGDKFLATFDALTLVAGRDDGKAAELLASVSFASAAVQDLLAKTTGKGILTAAELDTPPLASPEPRFEILVTCSDEHQQATLLEELTGRGLTVRSLIA